MPFTLLPVDIIRHILASATAPTLARFSATSRAADTLVVDEFNFRYEAMLAKYINHRPAFRAALGASRSHIAGSAAALFCGIPNSYVPGDLDVYCDEEGAAVMQDLLVSTEGYTEITERESPPYQPTAAGLRAAQALIPVTDVDRAFEALMDTANSDDLPPPTTPSFSDAEYTTGITNVTHLRRGDVYIDLITSSTEASTFPIINFWSTAPMCFLSEHAVHILYPRLQEERRVLLNPFRLPPDEAAEPAPLLVDIIGKHKQHTRQLIAKYVDRGYNVQHTEHVWDGDVSIRNCTQTKAAACPLMIRWVGDKCGMHFSLRGTVQVRMQNPPPQEDIGEYTSVWNRGGEPCGPLCSDRLGPSDATAYTTARAHISSD